MTMVERHLLTERLGRVPALGDCERATIRTAVERIVAVADPLRIILLGSRARGQARAESDIDLLVVLPDDADRCALWEQMLDAVNGLQPVVDIVPTTQTGFAERSPFPFFVERYALIEGLCIYNG